jgi:hypothetical protein
MDGWTISNGAGGEPGLNPVLKQFQGAMKMKKLNQRAAVAWIVAALILMVAGCVSSERDSGSLVLKTSIQYGTMKYLGSHPGHIEKAEFLVNTVAGVLESDTSTTLGRLETIVVESISWDTLGPEERLVLTALLTEIKYQVGLKIGEGVLDETRRVWGLEFLSWVRQAIQLSRV